MDNNLDKMNDVSKARYQAMIDEAANKFHIPVAKLAKNFGVFDQLKDMDLDIPEEPEDDDGLSL